MKTDILKHERRVNLVRDVSIHHFVYQMSKNREKLRLRGKLVCSVCPKHKQRNTHTKKKTAIHTDLNLQWNFCLPLLAVRVNGFLDVTPALYNQVRLWSVAPHAAPPSARGFSPLI